MLPFVLVHLTLLLWRQQNQTEEEMAELRYHVERQQQQLSDVAKVEQQVQALSQQKEDYHTNLVSHAN